MALKFRRGTAAQQSGSLIFGEPYINTDLNTLLIGGNGSQIQLLNISGGISSSLLPSTGSTFDLGSLARPWQHLYVASASIKFVDGAGTQVASLSAQQVNSLISGTGSYATTGSNVFNGNQTISGSALINSTTSTLGQFVGNQNGYVEFSVRNTSTGISASGDIVVYADTGTPNTNYIDMGINNSGVTQSISYAGAFIGDTLDGYLYNVGGDLWIGNASTGSKNIHIFNTGSAKPMITITQDTFLLTGSLNVIGGITGSILATNGVVSGSSQVVGILGSLNTYTGSNDTTNTTQNTRLTNLETTSASVNGHIADINSKTGSYAKNNSANTFNGNQIISGALTITQDLVVLGSSSIQNISSSNITIGSAYVTLNTFSPSSRFAGLRVIDSGSTGGSGSFLYDSVDDEWVFVHRGNGTNITSSHVVMGPETYDNLGNEIYMTSNRIPKVTNYEHLGDSNISDTGTLITLASNTVVNGTFVASGTSLVSGSSQITYASISSIPAGIVSGSTQVTPLLPTGTVSGSVQVTLSSTTGYGTVINQNLLTTSNVQHASLGIGMAASGTSGRIDASGDIIAFSTSDKNFKENITPIPNALEKISKISGNIYDWKSELKEYHGFEGNDVGVIAQEIEEVLPQLVTTRENGYKAVKYDKLVALLIEGIKEQQIQINELKAQIGSK
jgi:hypothetical protein